MVSKAESEAWRFSLVESAKQLVVRQNVLWNRFCRVDGLWRCCCLTAGAVGVGPVGQ